MSNVIALAPRLPHAAPDDPRAEIRVASVIGGIFFVGLLGWSAIARMDAAAYATGTVKVSGDAQSVQSLEGGVVSAVNVREGQQVRAGTVLIEFATTQALAQERSLAMRVIGLQADIARLTAEQSGASSITEPAEFASLTGRDRDEANRAMGVARTEFAAWQRTSGSEQRLLGERVAQVGNQIQGYNARQASNQTQLQLNRKELDAVQMLAAKGYATQTRVLALQRSAADLEGQRGAQAAEMARLRNETSEARMQLLQTRAQQGEQVSAQLRQAQTDLQSILPQWKAAQEVLARTQLRAQVSGAVMGLAIKAAGGVASPGQKLMEIVPQDRSLTVEAQVSPGDVNDLVVGQRARVRVSGLHGRNVPMLDGTVSRISADSFTDDRTGRSYYTASVRVGAPDLQRAARAAGIPGAIRPGTPVQVEVSLRPRTALEYLMEPLAQSLTGSFHER